MRMLYAIQDELGHEVTAWTGEVEKVSEIGAFVEADGKHVVLRRGADEVLGRGDVGTRNPAGFKLLRWPAHDKLGKWVRHGVQPTDA